MKPWQAHGLKFTNFKETRMHHDSSEVNASILPNEQKNLTKSAFAPKSFVVCSLPLLQPKNRDGSFVLTWERQDRDIKLGLSASQKFGLPFGKDRLLAYWLKSKSVLVKSDLIHFKDGGGILEELGLDPEGNNKIWLNGAVQRFTNTLMTYEEGDRLQGGEFEGALIIKKTSGYFDKRKDQKPSKKNSDPFFVLGDVFHKLTGVPIDLNTIHQIGRKWSVMDLYNFLSYRLWCKTRKSKEDEDFKKWPPLRIPLRDYRLQSGTLSTRSDKHLRADLKRDFKTISSISEYEPFLDDNDVITVPIIKPKTLGKNSKVISTSNDHPLTEDEKQSILDSQQNLFLKGILKSMPKP